MAAAVDTFANYPNTGLKDPGIHADAITTSDTVDLVHVSRFIYVGVAGDITLDTLGGETTVLFKAVPVGTVLPIRATRVRATGTAASNLVALY